MLSAWYKPNESASSGAAPGGKREADIQGLGLHSYQAYQETETKMMLHHHILTVFGLSHIAYKDIAFVVEMSIVADGASQKACLLSGVFWLPLATPTTLESLMVLLDFRFHTFAELVTIRRHRPLW